MKRYEVLGNKTPTLCETLGCYFSLGKAKKAADRAYDDPKNVLKYMSVDVDDGSGRVFYTKFRPPGLLRQILEHCGRMEEMKSGDEEMTQ